MKCPLRHDALVSIPEHVSRYTHRNAEYLLRRGVFIRASDGDLSMNGWTDPTIDDVGESAITTECMFPHEEVSVACRGNKAVAFDTNASVGFPTAMGGTATLERAFRFLQSLS